MYAINFATQSLSHIINLFFISFLFLNFSSPYSPKKKKKTLLFPISPHLLLNFL